MNTASNHPVDDNSSDPPTYRAISRTAVACLVFAIIGLSAFLSPAFILFPLLAIVFGIASFMNFKRFAGELIGRNVAVAGFWIAILTCVSAIGYHVYDYNTEVPDGHTRMSFADLKPDKRTGTPYSKKSVALHNQKIFLKGYTRPGLQETGMKNFILVGDFGDCCFGGDPDITDVVAIEIIGEGTVDYSWRKREIIGTFRLNPNAVRINEKDIPQVFYQIEADEVR